MRILVINTGSSSINFKLYDMSEEQLCVSGRIESIGDQHTTANYYLYSDNEKTKHHSLVLPMQDHAQSLQNIFNYLDKYDQLDSLDAIGHRVVHGGETFKSPTIIDEEIINSIRAIIPLAPLHNPVNLIGIEAARQACPEVPQVAVFDTAFFQSLPLNTSRYAIPEYLYRQHHVRRFGFHGISHQSVAQQAADYLQRSLNSLRQISLHLGNGASVAAIDKGRCIDTSMGMTPLEGLVMGTRAGDLDPAIVLYLIRELGLNADQIETLLNHESGLKGLCGVSDMRKVHDLVREGDEQARLAIDIYCYRIMKYIGAYYTALGGLDALIFTAGVGENDPVIRETVCNRLSVLGITLDQDRNLSVVKGCPSIISTDSSPVKVLVIPANEELQIARQTHIALEQIHPTVR